MLKFELEKIDLTGEDIVEIVNEVENYTFKGFDMGEEELRDISDYLDGLNISFKITGVNMLQYTIISTLRNVVSEIVVEEFTKFTNVNLGSKELNDEYTRLVAECFKIKDILKNKYKFDDELLEYIEPMTKTVDIRFSMTIKEFLRFVNTCSRYDELIDIIVSMDSVEELEGLLYIRTELAGRKDLFLRNKISKDVREELNVNENKVKLLSRKDKKVQIIEKVSTICIGSYVSFRNIVTNTKNFNIRLENPKHVDSDDSIPINIILPEEYSSIDINDINLIDKYIYGWICLINRIHLEKDYYEGKTILCHLGCFGVIFRMNNSCELYNEVRRNVKICKEARNLISDINKKIIQ